MNSVRKKPFRNQEISRPDQEKTKPRIISKRLSERRRGRGEG